MEMPLPMLASVTQARCEPFKYAMQWMTKLDANNTLMIFETPQCAAFHAPHRYLIYPLAARTSHHPQFCTA